MSTLIARCWPTYANTGMLHRLSAHLSFKLFVMTIRVKVGIVLVISSRLRRAVETWSCAFGGTARRKVSLYVVNRGLSSSFRSLPSKRCQQ